MAKLINYLFCSMIFFCCIVNSFSMSVPELKLPKDYSGIQITLPENYVKKISPEEKYQHAIWDYEKFKSLKCNGTFHYEVFDKVDQICDDCYHVIREEKLKSQCRDGCFKNIFFDGCNEMLSVNVQQVMEDLITKRLTLNEVLDDGPKIFLPEKPETLKEKPDKSVWRKIYETFFS